jgi:TfoX/Sxy family transcriptional regulator of competence genes
MAEKASQYKGELEKIIQENNPEIIKEKVVTYKNCFGAIAGYVDGNIFSSFGKFGLALKLPQSELKEQFEKGCEPLKYFPKGHIKKDYAIISQSIMENRSKIRRLIKKSVKFVAE